MNVNFTPGPSQLYFTVQDHARRAFRDGIPSLSHRSKAFETIFASTTDGLRELLEIPKGFKIVFASSATELWERSIQNLVARHSLHYVNGAFSRRYFEIAQQLGKQAAKVDAIEGAAFNTVERVGEPELIALTHNETSTGVTLPTGFIDSIRSTYPTALIVVDAVSSLPFPKLDYSRIDSVFFSVQKGFGLPAGLGGWIVNERCIAKANELQSAGAMIGTYHNLPTLISFADKLQTPETPNVLAIYLLSKVVADFLRRGIGIIRSETSYKSTLLYNCVEACKTLRPFVKAEAIRSSTVIVADCDDVSAVSQKLNARGLHPGDGYGKAKSTQLRFANFPAHSKEQYELLVDTLAGL